jgi:hypothetical protein
MSTTPPPAPTEDFLPYDPVMGHLHIRDMRKTREAFGLIGVDKPLEELLEGMRKGGHGITMCGYDTRERRDRIWFQDIDHAILHLRDSGDFGACRRCLRAILHVIREELEI